MNLSIKFVLLIAFFSFSTIAIAQTRAQFTSRLAKSSYQNKTCQCPEGSVVVTKSTVNHIDLAEVPVKSGEVYCLKNLNLTLEDLEIKGGKFILMPGTVLKVGNTLSLQAGKIELRRGARLEAAKIRSMSSTIDLKKDALLTSNLYFDYDSKVLLAENSSVEINQKMHVNASNGVVYDGDYSQKATFTVLGMMTGESIDLIDSDNYVEWNYTPVTASLND